MDFTPIERVIHTEPIFFGYPNAQPRANEVSWSTMMYGQYCISWPSYWTLANTMHSLYWARTGSSSSSAPFVHACQSTNETVTSPGSSGCRLRPGGSNPSMVAGSTQHSMVTKSAA
ncbi:hypothetical protein D3C84_790240 [compost metagenome]